MTTTTERVAPATYAPVDPLRLEHEDGAIRSSGSR